MMTTADIIERFGGSSAMANAINLVDRSLRPRGRKVTGEAVCNWRSRGRINQDWYPAILQAATESQVDLTADDLVAVNLSSRGFCAVNQDSAA